MVFKFKEAIDVDELLSVQFFEFQRTYTRQGVQTSDTVGCKIRGLRSRPTTVDAFAGSGRDDGTRIVKIEGCEYRVPKDVILAWLELFGSVESDLVEDVFKDDTDTDGTNRTGNYSVKMKLEKQIPQWLPMSGKRIKIYYRGIQKVCTNCFGDHMKRSCHSKKVLWIDYVKHFINSNTDIPDEYFGKWIEWIEKNPDPYNSEKTKSPTIQTDQGKQASSSATTDSIIEVPKTLEVPIRPATPATSSTVTTTTKDNLKPTANQDESPPTTVPAPKMSDFGVPANEDEFNSLIERFMSVGMKYTEAEAAISTRKTAFNKASREHKRDEKERLGLTNRAPRKGRKNSLENAQII